MSLVRRVLGLFGLAGKSKAAVGYRSISVARRDGRAPTMGSGDYHATYDRVPLIGMSREFYRDNAIYRGMIRRAAAYIVGSGFGLQARSSKAEWNVDAERVWARFWRRPELRGTLSGRGVERMIAQELLLCGDVGVVKTNTGAIQVVEAEQICGPDYKSDGVKRNATGVPLGYYVAPYGDGGLPQHAKAQLISTSDFLFLSDPERPTSSRGIPPAQAAFSMLHRINDVCDSEAFSWNLLSRMALSITRSGGALAAYGESEADTTSPDEVGLANSRVQTFDGVTIFHGEPGEEIKGIERNVPGKDFTASLTTFMRLLGLPLGLPLEFIMLDWTKSNYSQCRAILEQASVTFHAWQMLIEDFFLRPLYEWVIERAITSGDLQPNDEWDAHEWIKPAFPWIDQEKEAQASGLMVDRGFMTHAQVCKARNQDREDVTAQTRREVEDAIAIAQDIKARTGVDVPWQPFAGRSVPQSQPPAQQDKAAGPVDEPAESGQEDER